MMRNNAELLIAPSVPHPASLTLFAAFIALLVAAGCGGGSTSTNGGGNGSVAASVSGTIKVGTAPIAVAVDSTNNKIYVADYGTTPTGVPCSPSGADVETIDGATQSTTSVGFVGDPQNPYAAALNPANHTLYVATEAYWSGLKSGIDCGPDGGRVNGHVIGNFPAGIDVNPTTGSVYVASGGVVDVWDGSWNPVATIAVGSASVGVAVNATSNKIYVANSRSNDVSVIDGSSNSVVATITDPNAVSPVAVAVNATTNTIYVANAQSNNLSVIDGATNSVTATIPVGTSPYGVAVEPQTNFIYVANAGNSQSGNPGNVTVINGTTNATTTLSDPNATNPVAVATNSVTNEIYVANWGSNNVTVINGSQ
jgi:YVTN family beta-propeller protein